MSSPPDPYEVTVDGRSVPTRPGQSIAAALIAAGRWGWRTTRRGRPRGVFCGIGACFDCLVSVDGRRSVRACVTEARPSDVLTPPDAAPTTEYDVAVVGAGPAGLTAATTAAGNGLRVVLLDAGGRPGGQYFRHHDDADADRYGADFRRLRASVNAHAATGRLTYLPRHMVWAIEPRSAENTSSGANDTLFTVHAFEDGGSTPRRLVARAVIVATGAHDRHVPFPGWELPGVVAAGGAQALVKGSKVLPGTRIVVAGSGPFLLPVAAELAAAGAKVLGVYEASRARRYLRHVRELTRHPGRFTELASYGSTLAKHRVPYRTGHAVIAAHGTDRLEGVTIARLDARNRVVPDTQVRVPCDTLAVGYGFAPQLDLLVELGCELRVDPHGIAQAKVDPDLRTTVPGIYTAGETTGIGGAALAQVEGELAGLAVATSAARAVDGRVRAIDSARVKQLRSRRTSLQGFARVLGDVHAAPDELLADLPDSTLLCRCEEVSIAAVRHAVQELGATDLRSIKLLTRVGMGWCQGRICSAATAALAADLTGVQPSPADITAQQRRPLAQPVPLGILAQLDDGRLHDGQLHDGQLHDGQLDDDRPEVADPVGGQPNPTDNPKGES